MFLTVITPPLDTPVSVADAKAQIRLTVPEVEDDDFVEQLIEAATAVYDGPDGTLGRCLMPQTLELGLSGFYWDTWVCRGLRLPCGPVSAITSIKYTDASGVEQTFDTANYSLTGDSILAAYGITFPQTRYGLAAVRIRYVAGYEDAERVPAPIRHAIKLLVGHFYANRETVSDKQTFEVPITCDRLVAPYRSRTF